MSFNYDALSASDGNGEPNRATVQSPGRSIGSTTIPVDATTNWPTGTFIATTGTLLSTGKLDPATVQVFFGTASGTNITISSFAPGYTDKGNAVGDVVVIKPSTEWADTVADFIQNGAQANAGAWNLLGPTPTYGANNGNKEFTVTFDSDLTADLSPGMKMKFTRGTTPPTQCMAFSAASSQYATKASPSGITFTSAFTCEAWVYLNSYTGHDNAIISRYDGSSSVSGWGFEINSSGQVQLFYINASGTTSIASYQSIPLNCWVHVAATTTTSSSTATIYINGTSVPVKANASAANSLVQLSTNLSVGNYGAGVANSYFNGYISEARIWSVAQTQSSIQANMAINLTGSESNLVALFQGNGNFNDSTSNANNLTAQGGASATQAANPYNAIEYANVRAISYSNPTTTLTLYTSDAGTIPNQTLNSPQYSTAREPFGLPEVLNSKILGQVLWCSSQTNTATSFGTQITGGTMTMTSPSTTKKVVICLNAPNMIPASGTGVIGAFVGSVQVGQWDTPSSTTGVGLRVPAYLPSGSQTISLQMYGSGTGTQTLGAATNAPAWFTVEEA